MRLHELEKYYKGKKVLITGHTGFKGSWLTAVLILCGAKVYGYSLNPPEDGGLFDIVFGEHAGERTLKGLKLFGKNFGEGEEAAKERERGELCESHIADIRDFSSLKSFYDSVSPDYVFHLAAQPIVRDSYRIPRETYETNVMGTVNILECARLNPCPLAVLNVTTDKVYKNEEKPFYGYREDDKLDGFDPYSNSKSCSEIITHSYKAAFFDAMRERRAACGGRELFAPAVSTARAGNVIGGGDFANDRIIPDCVRAARKGEKIIVRNPLSVRPYQHVLEPLSVYLEICARSGEDGAFAGWYNVGPDDCDCVTTGELADMFVNAWGEGLSWECPGKAEGPHEANFLKLDNSKIKKVFSWEPRWNAGTAVSKTVAWSKCLLKGRDEANVEMERQIREFFG